LFLYPLGFDFKWGKDSDLLINLAGVVCYEMNITAQLLRFLFIVFFISLGSFISGRCETFGNFTFSITNSTVTIDDYTGPGGVVIVPETIQGYPVSSIGDVSFIGCERLTSVFIPRSVTSIAIIGNYFDFGAGGAFFGCTGLTNITVDGGNMTYSSMEGVLFDKGQATLLLYPAGKTGGYVIPDSVTNVGMCAFFDCKKLASITMGDNVANIGNSAFISCTGLIRVTLGNCVKTIGQGAFAICTSLSSIIIPNSVTSIEGTIILGGAEAGTFQDCISLTRVFIPNSVTNIGAMAFMNCSSLTNIDIPSSVSNIGNDAFNNCTRLTNVMMGRGVTNVADHAFSNCIGLTGVNFLGDAPTVGDLTIFDNSDKATVYYLPGTTGWRPTFGGRPTALWLPQVQPIDPFFGTRTNAFGFNLAWASNKVVVVEACTNLTNPSWIPVSTNTLTDGSSCFSDTQWANIPARFYRLRPM
jgi:hypothetical protein